MTITALTVFDVEGKIESVDALAKQAFPSISMTVDSVTVNGQKATIKYSYTADYFDKDMVDPSTGQPKKDAKRIGHIKMAGTAEVSESKETMANLLKVWNERKTLPPNPGDEVLSSISFRCGAAGTLTANALGLIPPLVLNRIRLEDVK